MNPMIEHMLTEVISYGVGTFLAAMVAAVSVGGFIWKKMHANAMQDEEIAKMKELLKIMSKHQLKMSCERALEKNCISLHDFSELKAFHDAYNALDFNSEGDTAFHAVETSAKIGEDC